MKVFCPNCGTDTEGTPGARVTCQACTATFDVPSETGNTRPPHPAPEPPPAQTPRPPSAYAAPPTAPGWTAPPPANMAPRRPPAAGPGTNTLAILSLLGALTCCIPLVSPGLGLGLGIVAMQQIETSNPQQGGKGLAVAGIVLGALSAVLQLITLIGLLMK